MLSSLVSDGTLVRTDDQIYFSAKVFAKAEQILKELIEKNGQLTLAEYRDALGTSRKYAVSILEYFDRQKITKKIGDVRTLV